MPLMSQTRFSSRQATAIGLLAVAFWSSVIGLVRVVSQHMGAVGGAAMTYSIATVLVLALFGRPNLRHFRKSYLFWASLFFVGCELCLSLSVGFAQNARQTVEVGMVNYLWPTFTIIGAVLFNRQPAKWWIVAGFILSFAGIAVVLGDESGFSLTGILQNTRTNPTSYIMALLDALFWAAYCTLTARVQAKGNAIGFFFLLVSCVLWLHYFAIGGNTVRFDAESLLYTAAAASCFGLGYAVWNIGISQGNMTILAGASYFIPIFSATISSALLNTPLTVEFWQGAAMVCAGSAVCWLATRTQKSSAD